MSASSPSSYRRCRPHDAEPSAARASASKPHRKLEVESITFLGFVYLAVSTPVITMFTESAELYDLIYSSFKDYGAEAIQIATLLRTIHPGCKTVLDVACGTGEHARLLAANHGFVVDGLDLDPQFVQIARKKHPAGHTNEISFSPEHLARYLMTQSNVIAAVEQGSESLPAVYSWLLESVGPLFPVRAATFLFGGEILFLQPTRN